MIGRSWASIYDARGTDLLKDRVGVDPAGVPKVPAPVGDAIQAAKVIERIGVRVPVEFIIFGAESPGKIGVVFVSEQRETAA